MTPPTIYSVTLSWNRREDTLACLASLVASDYPNLVCVLVDNASTDGTVEAVRAAYPHVVVIENPKNSGYAGGVVLGIQHALERGADFIWIVDNDAIVAPDALTIMLREQCHQPPAAVLTPKVMFYARPDVIWSMGYECRPITLARTHSWEGQPMSSANGPRRPAVYAPCCGLLIRHDVLKTIGLLDTYFFIYYEDLDFCLRARQAHVQLFSVPEAKVWHKVSASAGEESASQKYHLARSSVRFYRKHTPVILRPIIVLYRLGSAIRTTLRALRHRRPDVVQAYWRGLRDGWRDALKQSD